MHDNHILHHDVTIKATMNQLLHDSGLKDTLEVFKNLKNKQQKRMKQCFLTYKSAYILKVYSVRYTMSKNTNVKNRYKVIHPFFIPELQHSFSFNSQFLFGLKHKVDPSKSVGGIFHFRFCLVFIKVYILFNKNMDSLILKCYNSFQNENNRKVTHILFLQL